MEALRGPWEAVATLGLSEQDHAQWDGLRSPGLLSSSLLLLRGTAATFQVTVWKGRPRDAEGLLGTSVPRPPPRALKAAGATIQAGCVGGDTGGSTQVGSTEAGTPGSVLCPHPSVGLQRAVGPLGHWRSPHHLPDSRNDLRAVTAGIISGIF